MKSKGNVTIEKRTLEELVLVMCGRPRIKKRGKSEQKSPFLNRLERPLRRSSKL